MRARARQLTAVTIPALNPHLSLHFAQETHVCDLRDRDLVGIDAQTRRRLLQVDTYRLNVSHNDFKKVYRAKAPSTQSKTFSYPSELGELCAFARVIIFPIL